MIVNAIKNHHPERLMSWRRLTATAIPGMNKASDVIPLKTATPIDRSMIEVTIPTNAENRLHHQYSDRLDRVRKSKYRCSPEETAWAKVI